MMTHELQTPDFSWRGILNCPEANVLTSMEERELLMELVDCRRSILEAILESNGSVPGHSAAVTDFQQLVRELVNSDRSGDPPVAAIRPLVLRYQEIRTKLAMANVRLVAHVAKRYSDRGVAPSDLVQDGFCGLLLAIDRFDTTNETRLATYAIWWIRQAIQRAVASGAYPVRLNPKQLHHLAHGQDLSEAAGWSEAAPTERENPCSSKSIDRLLAATRPTVSLDAPYGYDGASSLIDFLVNPQNEETVNDELQEDVGAMMRLLNPREQMVVKLRFGLDGERRCSLIEVGQIMGVSKERIRQIQQRALEKLRQGATRHEVSRAG